MNRESTIEYLNQSPDILWDVIVIGGGATGLGVAMDAAVRGYKTLLLEQSDFTKGTSSRSTKLVHGGVRYLAQGDIKLVFEALHERGLLLQNAAHLADNQSFVVPSYGWWDRLKYAIGLTLYDLLAGKLSLGPSMTMSAAIVKKNLPTIQAKGLKGGILYHDGQFDDARLGINIAQTIVDKGGYVLNYMQVTSLSKDPKGKVSGVQVTDLETYRSYALKSKVVVNATGVFVDQVMSLDDPKKRPLVRPSQGTHLVLERSFLPSDYALMIPKTTDGRVLFAIPWHDKLVVGTTDTPLDEASLEPRPLEEEVDFILKNFGQYVSIQPTRADVLSVFSGLRPLARPQVSGKSTKEISRNHKLIVSPSSLITITGGKWTTFRKMAEDTMEAAIEVGQLTKVRCTTESIRIHGHTTQPDLSNALRFYGTDAQHIEALMESEPSLCEKLHPNYLFVSAEVVWAARNEMARTVEDVLARRIRILFMDAKAAIQMAPKVAFLLAKELKKGEDWQAIQVTTFTQLANGYLLLPSKQ